MKKLVFATRCSTLARKQTHWVVSKISNIFPDLVCEEKLITTRGDEVLDTPLPMIGGKGLFTRELEAALFASTADFAVHSLKDLPVEPTPGLILACVPKREDARDVIVSAKGFTLESLPNGAVIGTSSLRRAAQLLSLRPDLQVTSLRGNLETRIRKAMQGQMDAIILAGAGLIRLGLQDHITQWLDLEMMLPAPGQGALAVECRADDLFTREILQVLEDASAREAVNAERQFLRNLGGGCSVPVAAFAQAGETINMRGLVATPNGNRIIRVSGSDPDPCKLGNQLAEEAIASGANDILNSKIKIF